MPRDVEALNRQLPGMPVRRCGRLDDAPALARHEPGRRPMLLARAPKTPQRSPRDCQDVSSLALGQPQTGLAAESLGSGPTHGDSPWRRNGVERTRVTGSGDRFVFQIFYDEATRRDLDPGFIPLDNSANSRPDWYEFWVILNYLRSNPLRDEAWYGFLSPKFTARTGFTSRVVMDVLDQSGSVANVATFTPAWDQLAYFVNVFEQGECWHPGLTALTQRFLDEIGYPVNLHELVNHTINAAFSNYVIARAPYWRKWLSLAEKFWDFVEHGQDIDPRYRTNTDYGKEGPTPIKTFIQERFAAILLPQDGFRIVAPDQTLQGPIWVFFGPHPRTRRLLQVCDALKEKYTRTRDPEILAAYWKMRAEIPVASALPSWPPVT